jgi:hypothetical protein
VSTVLAQWLVTLNDRAIGHWYLLYVTIIQLVDEPIDLGNCAVSLEPFAPVNLNGLTGNREAGRG